MKKHWTVEDIPNLQGKTAIVTGANSGLGLEIAQALAAAGAQVTLACRSQNKAEAAMQRIRQHAPQAELDFQPLNLADLSSIRDFASQYADRHERLDRLCNNAGVMALPLCLTADGFEMQIGTNHLGHFALTGRLLPLLQASPDARVATMSSIAHRPGKIRFDDLNWERGKYSKWAAYSQSKLANLLFTFELQRRFEQHDVDAIAVAAHPGYASTHLQLAGPEMTRSGFGKALMKLGNGLLGQSAARGALPMLYAVTDQDIQGGDYIGPDGPMEMRGWPKKVGCTSTARDTGAAKRLWALSEQLTDVSYLD